MCLALQHGILRRAQGHRISVHTQHVSPLLQNTGGQNNPAASRINISTMMSEVSCQHSKKCVLHQVSSRKRACSRWGPPLGCAFPLVVPHLARLSQLDRGRPRPCSRRAPAGRAVSFFFFCENNCSENSSVYFRTCRCISVYCSSKHKQRDLL